MELTEMGSAVLRSRNESMKASSLIRESLTPSASAPQLDPVSVSASVEVEDQSKSNSSVPSSASP
jgi:hypothetical protein